MLLKCIGSIIIILSTSYFGWTLSKELAQRPSDLRTLQSLFQLLENEICFLSSILTDALENCCCAVRHRTTVFFKKTSEYLQQAERMNASAAWEKAVRENLRTTSLDGEDEEILVLFGRLLGGSDLDGQLNNIRMTISQLKLQEQKAEEMKKKNQAVYSKLGVLAGVAIVIVIF